MLFKPNLNLDCHTTKLFFMQYKTFSKHWLSSKPVSFTSLTLKKVTPLKVNYNNRYESVFF